MVHHIRQIKLYISMQNVTYTKAKYLLQSSFMPRRCGLINPVALRKAILAFLSAMVKENNRINNKNIIHVIILLKENIYRFSLIFQAKYMYKLSDLFLRIILAFK